MSQAITLMFGRHASEREKHDLSAELMAFLNTSIGSTETTHAWLQRFSRELITPWRGIARSSEQEWDVCAEMIINTDPARDLDLPLAHFAGRIEGAGRANLSTLHSAKGREFDAVIMYGINAGDIPNARDSRDLSEHHHSPWVVELYQRSQQD